jgi:hypothetical protein
MHDRDCGLLFVKCTPILVKLVPRCRSPPAAKADHQGAPRSLDAYIERGSIATANAFVGAMVVLMLTHSMGTLGNFFRLTFCVQFAAYVVGTYIFAAMLARAGEGGRNM